MIKGKDLFLYIKVSGVLTPVAYAQNCELSIVADPIECTTLGSNSFKDYVYGERGFTITHSGLSTYQKSYSSLAFQQAIINGTKLDFAFGEYTSEGVVYSGSCMVTQTDQDSSYDGISTFKASLLGCGALVLNQSAITNTLYIKGLLGATNIACAVGGDSSLLFPCSLYNVNQNYLGTVNTAAELVAMWNSDAANQAFGVLSAGSTPCDYVLTSASTLDQTPTYIIADSGTIADITIIDGNGS